MDLECSALYKLLELALTQEPHYFQLAGWLHHAFQAAYYWLLHAKDFRGAMLSVVNRLGDPDTNGAIVGALLGATIGRRAIPQEWVDTILQAPGRTRDFNAARGLSLLASLMG